MRARILLLAGMLLTTVPAAPSRAQAPALTGADAWTAVVGNTIVGETPAGEALVEYFAPDGVVKTRIDDKSGEGEWSLRGAKICTDYSDDDDDEEDDDAADEDSGGEEESNCYDLFVRGDALTLTDDGGAARLFRILPGNAEKL
ncbi:MAG TPA: hypothetical protein PKA55_05595 [Rhodoblastus sp.]|nr:hypothetical protein [Rhodoblastus sp.]